MKTNGTVSPGILEQQGWRQTQWKKNKAVKVPFDAMGKGIEMVSKERRYSWHDHIKNVMIWVEDREV